LQAKLRTWIPTFAGMTNVCMTYETETKILDVDKKQIGQTLASLGAKKILDTKFVVDWFWEPGTKEGEEPWFLRIRTDTEGNSEVTWKARSEKLGKSRTHKEINFKVGDAGAVGEFLKELKLENNAHQEKFRISWELKDWRFDLDEYPGMPAYLEIEGTSEEHIQEAIRILGLKNHKTSNEGERILIQKEYGLDWYRMRF